MEVISTEQLDAKTTIEHVVISTGHDMYRVCCGGTCRFTEDRYVAGMYAEHFGWKPQAS